MFNKLPKPISPDDHILIDYVFVAAILAAPSVLGFKGAARAVCYGIGATAGTLVALSDSPKAVKPLIPMKVHGALDAPFVPALVAVPLACGAMKKPKERWFFISYCLGALTNFLLTDYEGKRLKPPRAPDPLEESRPDREVEAKPDAQSPHIAAPTAIPAF